MASAAKKTKSKGKRYITLRQATKLCGCSQDCLGLHARQKKLKAVKMGKDWMTTREWLDEYGRQMERLARVDFALFDKTGTLTHPGFVQDDIVVRVN